MDITRILSSLSTVAMATTTPRNNPKVTKRYSPY